MTASEKPRSAATSGDGASYGHGRGDGQRDEVRVEIDAALAEARAAGLASLDARLLLGHALQRPPTWLIAHGDAPLPAATLAAWRRLLLRRRRGEPVAYLLGEKEFAGLAFFVDSNVLVPRPETELLVDWAGELLAGALAGRSPLGIADLGTGSGAVAIALKQRHPRADVVAVDRSAAALAVARRNVERHGGEVELVQSDWFAALGARTFDLVVANPPYIAAADPHLASLRHEPHGALVGGDDGLEALRRIAADAPRHLRPGGWLLLEHGFDQAEAVRCLLVAAGLAEAAMRHDLAGLPRISGARRR